jgi:hypothetical protein
MSKNKRYKVCSICGMTEREVEEGFRKIAKEQGRTAAELSKYGKIHNFQQVNAKQVRF